MIIINAQRDDDADHFGRRNTFLRVDFRRETWPAITESEARAEVQGARPLVVVHGYNNELPEILSAYGRIAQQIAAAKAPYDVIVGFAWPGGDMGIEWYSSKGRAGASGARFAEALATLFGDSRVDVMSHSLGARVVMKALRDHAARIGNYYCMAAAVDNEVLEKGEEFAAVPTRCTSLRIFHSKRDMVLSNIYRIAECNVAMGLHGPEDPSEVINSKNVYVVNCKNVVGGHSDYKDASAVFRYIRDVAIGQEVKDYCTL